MQGIVVEGTANNPNICFRKQAIQYTEGRESLSTDDLLRDTTIGLDNNLVDLERRLDGIGLVVHPFKLLEGTALRLDTGQIVSLEP